MLGRKKGEAAGAKPTDPSLRESVEPARPPSAPVRPAVPVSPAAIPRRLADIPPIASRPAANGAVSRSENKRLTVGKEIQLNGEITACDLLVVEGNVDATLSDARELQIARGGRFSGSAEVEEADVSGEFIGRLVARQRLVVRAGGKVDGDIRYGKIEIEAGGQVSGQLAVGTEPAAEVETHPGAEPGAPSAPSKSS